ncbi:MAG: GTPase HflX [Defluviitaleaceae bacterium]|nr:GTPase HflX [Defluviitaleaceae bacterium]
MHKIEGSTNGIRRSYLQQLEAIFDMEVGRKDFCPLEILEALSTFTQATGREAMVYIDRQGRIETVTVGEQDRVSLPALRKRRSESRLSGIRCIHTHPGGNGMLSDIDIQSLKHLRLDAMAAVGVIDGRPASMQVGILDAPAYEAQASTEPHQNQDDKLMVTLIGPFKATEIPEETLWAEIELADDRIRPQEARRADAEIARAILVGLESSEGEPLAELRQLADTAGFVTVGSLVQSRPRPDKATYLGQGKLQDLALEIQRLHADTVIFDDELTPSQLRNIQKALGKKTELIDRTALILDIFSGRASTHEGRLQVELAQAKYLLPRMTGYWTHFTRMAGGGGGGGGARRGEGETQLEVDRRLLRRRVTEMEREIDKVKARREVQRAQRERSNIPVVALVGYTNAGKSTLMNSLSGSDVLAEDKLFATLDPKARNVNFGSGEFLLIDTVGFINKLPHDLVNAFRATLEEARFADLLLHVVDASSESQGKQMEVVNEVLGQLEANQNPILMVYNKCDVAGEVATGTDGVAISAMTGLGMDKLKEAIGQSLAEMRVDVSVLLPLDAGALVSRVYSGGKVHNCEYREDGIFIQATVSQEDAARLRASDCSK